MTQNPAPSSQPPPHAGLLKACLPPAPGRLLWVGGDPGGWAEALTPLAGRLERLPDPRALAEGQAPQAPEGCYAGIVVAELSDDADGLAVFPPAFDLLAPGGVLVLAEPAERQIALAARRGTDRQAFYAALAARYGFRAAALPGGADSAPLRCFTRDAPPRWRLRHARAQDAPSLLRLFRQVFGHEMSPALWRWKYGDGRGGVIAQQDGEIVAHYGGMTRRIVLFGRPDRAFQICDVMVSSRERAVLTRTGPFFLTAAAFAERAACTHIPFGYGFPNARVMRLAEKTGLYAEVGAMAEIRWTPLSGRPRLTTRVRHMPAPLGARDREIIDALWAKMKDDLRDAVAGVRDAQYVQHRYLDHPHHRYELLLVTSRFTGAARGLLVLRRHDRVCELLDIVAPLKNIPGLVGQARRLLAHWGVGELYAWISRHQAGRFTATGGEERPLDVRIPTSIWIDGPPVESVRDRWWLMSGDTDFR